MALADLRTPDRWMAIVGAVLLVVYFVLAVKALASPSGDPQWRMAQGFITMVAVVLLSLGGPLWYGVRRKRPWLIRILFALIVFPALSQTAQEIYLFVRHAG